jgi:ferredoxin
MRTIIYYFSGTGNSLYVARELQKRIPETDLIPMVRLLHNDVIVPNGTTVGVVFPIHLTTDPIPVINFMQKVDVQSATYLFAIATRIGTTQRAFLDIDHILQKKGKRLDAYFTLNMASNDSKFKNWQPVTQEDLATIEAVVQERLDAIQQIILRQAQHRGKDTQVITPVPAIFIRLIPFFLFLGERFGLHEQFYADSKCTGCGLCEQVCLSNKIQMINNTPVWQKHVTCYRCYACLNYCPVQSVQIKSTHTEKNGRYSHPYATADDIAGQK